MNLITKLIPVIVTSITAVERLVRGRGKEKQDAAIEIIKLGLQTIEDMKGKDLLNDPEVERLTRVLIDAIVALQNIMVKKNA